MYRSNKNKICWHIFSSAAFKRLRHKCFFSFITGAPSVPFVSWRYLPSTDAFKTSWWKVSFSTGHRFHSRKNCRRSILCIPHKTSTHEECSLHPTSRTDTWHTRRSLQRSKNGIVGTPTNPNLLAASCRARKTLASVRNLQQIQWKFETLRE